MATGQKISAQTPATSFDSGDLMTIVQSGANLSVDHDVLMDDTQICKAWVNFNGTGVVAIRDDFNVSSITDNATGDYTVNFTNAMDDALYSSFGLASTVTILHDEVAAVQTINNLSIRTLDSTHTPADALLVSIQVFAS